ncbi:MAG: transcriptional regulator [Planctomycetota bacterium]|nr:transcriptional regulator [Planctomycetota bacterium]
MAPETTISDAKRKVLDLLKRQTALTAVNIASQLQLTDVAIRQHLGALEELGLVESKPLKPNGRGRPSSLWSLTDLADDLFPDHHADLTVDLINATRKALGEDGLLQIIEVRSKEQVSHYRTMIPKGASLKKRVEALAALRSAEGYMAEVEQEKPGQYLLIEHHCPICDAAKTCQGFCNAELDVFRKVLGRDVNVERIHHLMTDGDRCVYRIVG